MTTYYTTRSFKSALKAGKFKILTVLSDTTFQVLFKDGTVGNIQLN